MALFDEFGVLITADNVLFRKAFMESEEAVNAFKKRLKEAGAAGRETEKILGTVGNRAKTYGTEVARARQHTANLAAQFNDIGVMMAAGQSPVILAMQQGTQINQVFSAMGSNIRDVGRSMKAALTSIISPMSLLTIGLIAGTAALVNWGREWFNAGAEARKAIAEARAAKIEGLMDLGAGAAAQAEALQLQHQKNLATKEEARVLLEIKAIRNQLVKVENEYRDAGWMRRRQLKEERELLQGQLSDLTVTVAQLRKAAKVEAEVKAAKEATLKKQREIYDALFATLNIYDDVIAKTGDWTRELGNAARAAWAAGQAMARSIEQGRLAGAGRGLTDPSEDPGMSLDPYGFREQLRKDAKKDKKPGGGGKEKNPILEELEKLREALKTEAELELASFESRKLALDNALNARLLTTEEHHRLMEQLQQKHAEKMTAIDAARYGTASHKAASVMNSLATIFESGNEKMQRIAKIFGAGEALINAWRAYAQTLADPTANWVVKFARAAAVLSAGLSAVQAIKSVNKGGGGGAAAGGTVGTGGGTGGSSAASSSTYYNVSFAGEGYISQASMRGFIEQLNKAIDDGAVIRGITVS